MTALLTWAVVVDQASMQAEPKAPEQEPKTRAAQAPSLQVAGAPHLQALSAFAGSARAARLRAGASAATVLGGCALWFITLARLGVSTEALPWYIVVGCIGVVCAHRASRPVILNPELPFAPAAREPLTLLESWAIAFLIAATTLYVWVSIQSVLPKQKPHRIAQFVDIQLVSPKDFENRSSPLPGTETQDELHKRDSDQITRQGSMTATKVASIAHKTQMEPQTHQAQDTDARSQSKPTKESQARAEHIPTKRIVPPVRTPEGKMPVVQPMAGDDMILIKPAPQSTRTPTGGKQSTKGKANGNQPLIEEVQPPELVELIENDGSRESPNVFEAGGSSEGGTGAPSDLQKYIKDLHQRIKHLWSPPRGQSHKAAILFRIRKDGKLAFVRLLASSGDYDTDSAALKAVTGAVNGKPLPDADSLPYLDVQYTFNYTADELKELNQKAPWSM